MADLTAPARRIPRFTTRGILTLIGLVALALGWVTSVQRAERERRQNAQRMLYAEEELRRAREELSNCSRGLRPDRARAFWEAGLEGSNLAGMTIASTENAFQRASFHGCRLEGATLSGGVASFQFARFDAANLARATLTGGSSSFQIASFVGADLTGATLTGAGGSFQRATFEDAILVGAKLAGSFQGVNLSGARLEAADLTAIARDDLATGYFKTPPTYDARTKLPPGFDPVERSWRRVE